MEVMGCGGGSGRGGGGDGKGGEGGKIFIGGTFQDYSPTCIFLVHCRIVVCTLSDTVFLSHCVCLCGIAATKIRTNYKNIQNNSRV